MILDKIVAHKREELETRKAQRPLAEAQAAAADAPAPRNFATALAAPGVRLIAEVKRASPSKGVFVDDLNPTTLARTYLEHGASAISVLTDERFFQGSLDDLRQVREVADIPVLRKDFIIDPYQILEARAAGADAVLLIVAILDDETLAKLQALAQILDMHALVEVHNEGELDRALEVGAPVIGINNRNLRDFTVDLGTTERLCRRLSSGTIVVAESGISTADDVRRLGDAGANAILVGEALVTAEDTAEKARELAQAVW
ncbi:MAG: Indole-3-glycerol phosphate synthase [Anaerolineales bacterium]|nr:Indole-3-glycerol phosphate synthase [Anaerolineales bacterium]